MYPSALNPDSHPDEKSGAFWKGDKRRERQTEIAVAMAGDVGIRDKEGGKGEEGRKFHLISI